MSTSAGGLKELHELHIQLQQVQEQLERGPKQVRARRQFAERKQEELERARKQYTELRKAADEKSLQLKSNESKIAELKIKLNSASSNREFDIIKTQIDADSMANSVLEDEILEALEKVDQMQRRIKTAEQDHTAAQSEAQRVAEEVAAAEPGLRERIGELESALRIAEQSLPDEVAEVYRRLVHAHGSGALAPVVNKACTACYAILSPQHNIELNLGKILFCKSCGRLLYRPDAGQRRDMPGEG